MSWHTAPTPARWPWLDACAAMLGADAALAEVLGGPGRVASHRLAPAPPEEEGAYLGRALLRLPTGLAEHARPPALPSLLRLRFQVYVEFPNPSGLYRPELSIEAAHSAIHRVLTAIEGCQTLPAGVRQASRVRLLRPPTAVALSDGGRFYSTADFSALLRTTTAAGPHAPGAPAQP